MKLVVVEAETRALQQHLQASHVELIVSSVLARVEILRALGAAGEDVQHRARELLAAVALVPLGGEVAEFAAKLAPCSSLRSLDAIHVASALVLGPEVDGLVTYDLPMALAARDAGLEVRAPGR